MPSSVYQGNPQWCASFRVGRDTDQQKWLWNGFGILWKLLQFLSGELISDSGGVSEARVCQNPETNRSQFLWVSGTQAIEQPKWSQHTYMLKTNMIDDSRSQKMYLEILQYCGQPVPTHRRRGEQHLVDLYLILASIWSSSVYQQQKTKPCAKTPVTIAAAPFQVIGARGKQLESFYIRCLWIFLLMNSLFIDVWMFGWTFWGPQGIPRESSSIGAGAPAHLYTYIYIYIYPPPCLSW